jgi:hypothetical protein
MSRKTPKGFTVTWRALGVPTSSRREFYQSRATWVSFFLKRNLWSNYQHASVLWKSLIFNRTEGFLCKRYAQKQDLLTETWPTINTTTYIPDKYAILLLK